jgi:hypothetical protein
MVTEARDALTLSREELTDMFKHFDGIVQSKENLFIPVSLGIVLAVLLQWSALPFEAVGVAAVTSVSLYLYLLLVIKRFGSIQDNIYRRIAAGCEDFANIMRYPRAAAVRSLRYYLFSLLVVAWAGLLVLKK